MQVLTTHLNRRHTFSKEACESITLIEGLGVQGDAHCGVTVQHRSRVAKDPFAPNLRQVHLLHSELLNELLEAGFEVPPGALGENINTQGIDLLALPTGAELRLGQSAVVQITGLRNPCLQIDNYRRGLMAAVLGKTPDGQLVRKAGVMAVVLKGGVVAVGDRIRVKVPKAPHSALQPV